MTFSGHAKGYLHGTGTAEQARLEAQARLLGGAGFLPELKPGMRILEVGCGTGAIAREVAWRIEPGIVIGVDREESQLETARRFASEQGTRNIEFLSSEAEKLDFDDDEFNAAYCRFLLEHVVDPLHVIREMIRVVKPGAWLCAYEWANDCDVCYPDSPAVRESWLAIYGLQARHGGDPWIAKKLYGLFRQTELCDVKADASTWTVTADDREALSWYINGAREITSQAREGLLSTKLASEELLARAEKEYERLLDSPHTFIVAGFCRAVGVKPSTA